MLGYTKEELLNRVSSFEISEWIVELNTRYEEEKKASKKKK